MGIYLFKVKGRITKTICNSVFIANFAESQNKAIAIRRFMDVLITFHDVYGGLIDVFYKTSLRHLKKKVATSIWDQCKTSVRTKIRRFMDVLITFHYRRLMDVFFCDISKNSRHDFHFGPIQDVFETKN